MTVWWKIQFIVIYLNNIILQQVLRKKST
jgi:hypothetical protein